MRPYSRHKALLPAAPGKGLISSSHHMALRDELNGYCLYFFSSPKAFND